MLVQSSFRSSAANGTRKLVYDFRSTMPMDISDHVAKLLTVQLPLRLSSVIAKASSFTDLEEALRIQQQDNDDIIQQVSSSER